MHKACPFWAVSVFSLSRIARYASSLQDETHLKNNCALYHTLILFTYLSAEEICQENVREEYEYRTAHDCRCRGVSHLH